MPPQIMSVDLTLLIDERPEKLKCRLASTCAHFEPTLLIISETQRAVNLYHHKHV